MAHNIQLAALVVLSINALLFVLLAYATLRDGRRRSKETLERYGTLDPAAFNERLVVQRSLRRRIAMVLCSGALLFALAFVSLMVSTWDALSLLAVTFLSFLFLVGVLATAGSWRRISVSDTGLLGISSFHGIEMLRWDDIRYISYDPENSSFFVSDGVPEEEQDPDAAYVPCHEFGIPSWMPGAKSFLKMALSRIPEDIWRSKESLKVARTLAEGE